MKKYQVVEYEKSDFEEIFDYVKEQKAVNKEELWDKFKHTWKSLIIKPWPNIDDMSRLLRYEALEEFKFEDCYLYELKAAAYNNVNLIYQKGLDKDLEELAEASSCFDDSGYHQDRIPRETAIEEVKKAGLEKWLPFCLELLTEDIYNTQYLRYRWRAASLHKNLWKIIRETHYISNPLAIEQTAHDVPDAFFYVRLPFLIETDKIIQIKRIKKECEGKFKKVSKEYIRRLTQEYGENFVNQIKTELK